MTLDEAMAWADTSPQDQRGKPSQASAITLAAEVRRLQAAICKDCSLGHMADRIAQLEAEATALRLYAPAQRAWKMSAPVRIAPTRWPRWGIVGIVQETDEEFSAKGRVYVEITR